MQLETVRLEAMAGQARRERRLSDGHQTRWPKWFREKIKAAVKIDGTSLKEICRRTGLSRSLVKSWLGTSEFFKNEQTAFQEIAVINPQSLSSTFKKSRHLCNETNGDLILIGRNGNEVRGLAIGDVVEFLRSGVL